jgi:hypothetical protein
MLSRLLPQQAPAEFHRSLIRLEIALCKSCIWRNQILADMKRDFLAVFDLLGFRLGRMSYADTLLRHIRAFSGPNFSKLSKFYPRHLLFELWNIFWLIILKISLVTAISLETSSLPLPCHFHFCIDECDA